MIVKVSTSDYAKLAPDTSGVLVNKACEVVLLKLVSGSGAATYNLYDSATGAQGEVIWVMDSSQTFPDTDQFTHPLRFRRGIYAQQVQGAGTNSQLFAAIISISPTIA